MAMHIQFFDRICPEAECIFLLERRFLPGADAQHNIEQVIPVRQIQYPRL